MGFENLPDVHSAGNAERVQDDLDRRAVGQVRQILLRQDPRDHALVAVAAGHLVSDLKLALHGDVDLDQLDDARRQLVALLQQLDALLVDVVQDLDVRVGLAIDQLHASAELLLGERQAEDFLAGQRLQGFARDALALVEHLLAGAGLDRRGHHLPEQQIVDLLVALLGEDPHLVAGVLLEPVDLLVLDLLGANVLLDSLAGEDLDVDDRAFDARRHLERGVADVAGLLAEDRPQQLLFRGQLGLALRRHLADQDVARP